MTQVQVEPGTIRMQLAGSATTIRQAALRGLGACQVIPPKARMFLYTSISDLTSFIPLIALSKTLHELLSGLCMLSTSSAFMQDAA